MVHRWTTFIYYQDIIKGLDELDNKRRTCMCFHTQSFFHLLSQHYHIHIPTTQNPTLPETATKHLYHPASFNSLNRQLSIKGHRWNIWGKHDIQMGLFCSNNDWDSISSNKMIEIHELLHYFFINVIVSIFYLFFHRSFHI